MTAHFRRSFLEFMHFPDVVMRHRAKELRSGRACRGARSGSHESAEHASPWHVPVLVTRQRRWVRFSSACLLLSACRAQTAEVPPASNGSPPPAPDELE